MSLCVDWELMRIPATNSAPGSRHRGVDHDQQDRDERRRGTAFGIPEWNHASGARGPRRKFGMAAPLAAAYEFAGVLAAGDASARAQRCAVQSGHRV